MSNTKCEHCSRSSDQGHHPDCPNHADRQPKTVTIPLEAFVEVRKALAAMDVGDTVPKAAAAKIQPLINAVNALLEAVPEDPTS